LGKFKIFLVVGIVLLFGLSSYVTTASASEQSELPKDGVLNSVLYKETPLNKESVQIQKTTGYSAESNLIEDDGVLKGNISIKEGSENQVYSLKSTDTFKKNDRVVYTGLVENTQQYFEAFITEDRDSMTINIFGLKDENGDFEAYENRIDPFTVKFNQNSKLVKPTTETFIDNSIISDLPTKKNMGLVELGQSRYDGIGVSIQTVLGRTSESPMVTRIWTDESGAKKHSNQPQPTTAWIREAVFVHGSSITGTVFDSADPNQSGVKDFSLPFSWKGIEIPIKVKVNETILSSNGFDNPLQLNLIWNLKRANSFEYGKNSEGIAQQLYYKHDGRKNSDGQYEVDFTTLLLYELVGNEREYLPFGIEGTALFY